MRRLFALIPLLLSAGLAQPLPAGSWTLYRTGRGNQHDTVTRAHKPTIRFENGRVTGNASCNTYFGGYSAEGAELELGPLGATRKACAFPAEGLLEARFLNSLAKVKRYGVSGGFLVLYTTDRETLVFKRSG